jgi:hypothetical protein
MLELQAGGPSDGSSPAEEVTQAIAARELAYEQYALAVCESNTDQFDLYRALGQPAEWVTSQAASTPALAPAPVSSRTAAAPGR